MKRILLDVDAVVADLHKVWLKRYNSEYDDKLRVEDIVDWDMTKFVKPECGNKIYDYLSEDDLYENVQPIDGAVASIHWLRQHNYDVVFCTSGVQPGKIIWLHNHGLLWGEFWRFAKDVVIASDKTLIKGDIIIDDNPKNCEQFAGKSILFAQPWNLNSSSSANFRAENWPDVIQYLARNL